MNLILLDETTFEEQGIIELRFYDGSKDEEGFYKREPENLKAVLFVPSADSETYKLGEEYAFDIKAMYA